MLREALGNIGGAFHPLLVVLLVAEVQERRLDDGYTSFVLSPTQEGRPDDQYADKHKNPEGNFHSSTAHNGGVELLREAQSVSNPLFDPFFRI